MEQSTSQYVILVNERDEVVGYEEKIAAHRDGGKRHRAFSVLVFNSRGEMLLQLRSKHKYHFGGLWTNTCCGHPMRDEATATAATQRLQQEFGFQTLLRESFSFYYEAHDPVSGLTEREWDHVLEGTFDGTPLPNAAEIDDFKWVSAAWLVDDVHRHPEQYTPWFPILLQRRF